MPLGRCVARNARCQRADAIHEPGRHCGSLRKLLEFLLVVGIAACSRSNNNNSNNSNNNNNTCCARCSLRSNK